MTEGTLGRDQFHERIRSSLWGGIRFVVLSEPVRSFELWCPALTSSSVSLDGDRRLIELHGPAPRGGCTVSPNEQK
jgi:hypothetical protein